MIKRYILHLEAHRNIFRYRPRISFKRAPRAGDRVKDGGVMGTLRLCPTCQEGFLHEPDPVRPKRSRLLPPGPHRWQGGYCIECENNALYCPYPPRPRRTPLLERLVVEVAKSAAVGRSQRVRSDHRPRPAMDFNRPRHVELKVDEPVDIPTHIELKDEKKKPEPSVVKLTVTDEDPILKAEDSDESPETLELGYALGTHEYKRGDEVWTRKADYVVDKLEDDVLYLVRKDVWEARKKAKHVKLEIKEPAEHVELKDEEEKPGIVQLKFE